MEIWICCRYRWLRSGLWKFSKSHSQRTWLMLIFRQQPDWYCSSKRNETSAFELSGTLFYCTYPPWTGPNTDIKSSEHHNNSVKMFSLDWFERSVDQLVIFFAWTIIWLNYKFKWMIELINEWNLFNRSSNN